MLPFAAGLCVDVAAARLSPGDEPEAAREARHAARAAELRLILTELGPTFIKFGQMLSIRPDVIPPAAVYELQKLCDAVPGYPTPAALRLMEHELGAPVRTLFEGIDESSEPIAAASLGQVYRCRLRSTGEEVALKVQRPDMIRAVTLDLYLLRRYMAAVEWFKVRVLTGVFGAASRASFDVALLDHFASATFLELDYEHEAGNQERFAAQLCPRLGGRVYVPRVHRECTSRKVIATEWIEGVQLAKSSPEVINRLIPTGVECFLSQLLDVGFFHSDPHPGNLLVDEQGRLVLIDFGLCAEIAQIDSTLLTTGLVHLMRRDVAGLLEDAIALGFLPPSVDRAALLPAMQAVFDKGSNAARQPATAAATATATATASASTSASASASASAFAGEASIDGAASHKGGVGARRAQFGAISRDLNSIFFEYPFTVPPYFALITRALIVLEGIAVTGDRDFDLFAASFPYAVGHARRLFGVGGLAAILGEAGGALAAGETAAVRTEARLDAGVSAASGGRGPAGSQPQGRWSLRSLFA